MATVPAHPALWSDHDVALHHFRRYTDASFRKLLRAGRFRPIKYSYGISFMHPLIVSFRMMQKAWQRSTGIREARPRTHLIPLPKPINNSLIRLLHLEAALIRRIDFPKGTSLVVLAQKAEEAKPLA